MSSVPVLYHTESSFYSQLARLAFGEKGIRYKSRIVDLSGGEVYTPEFLQNVNPKGTVPAMEHLGFFITDSKDIIDYVDALPSEKPRLCPGANSESSARVQNFWEMMDNINIEVITFGSLLNRHLTSNCQAPSFLTRDKLSDFISRKSTNIAKLNQDYPDLAATMKSHSQNDDFLKTACDESSVLKALEMCDQVLEEVEEELQKRKDECGDDNFWLCGRTFTIADISLSCILHRLTFVGQSERLFLSNRPLTSEYYLRVLQRQSFKKECVYANSVFWAFQIPMFRSAVKKARPLLTTSLIAGICVLVYYKKDQIKDILNEIHIWCEQRITKPETQDIEIAHC